MDDETPWTLMLATELKVSYSAERLAKVITDIPSWLSLMELAMTGRPATVRIIRNDGVVEVCKVVETAKLGTKATFNDPLAS